MIYGTCISFWDFNAKLCGLKQGDRKSPKDYYKWMVDISVALKEYHGDRFQQGELARPPGLSPEGPGRCGSHLHVEGNPGM